MGISRDIWDQQYEIAAQIDSCCGVNVCICLLIWIILCLHIVWLNSNISLTWIVRPFGDDFPYLPRYNHMYVFTTSMSDLWLCWEMDMRNLCWVFWFIWVTWSRYQLNTSPNHLCLVILEYIDYIFSTSIKSIFESSLFYLLQDDYISGSML